MDYYHDEKLFRSSHLSDKYSHQNFSLFWNYVDVRTQDPEFIWITNELGASAENAFTSDWYMGTRKFCSILQTRNWSRTCCAKIQSCNWKVFSPSSGRKSTSGLTKHSCQSNFYSTHLLLLFHSSFHHFLLHFCFLTPPFSYFYIRVSYFPIDPLSNFISHVRYLCVLWNNFMMIRHVVILYISFQNKIRLWQTTKTRKSTILQFRTFIVLSHQFQLKKS